MSMGFEKLKGKGIDRLNPFRFGTVAGKILLTNEVGEFVFLTPDEFELLTEGKLEPDHPRYAELESRHFFRSARATTELADRYATKNRFLFSGPYLHIVIVTLRCNEVCRYCHASRRDLSDTQSDMTPEMARTVVDTIFQTTSPSITIEFQGGEPLVNWEVVKVIIEYAVEKNRTAGKNLEFSLVSNLAMMTDDKLEYLMNNNVQICTSIDGPGDLHDSNRKLVGGSAHEHAVKWMKKTDEAYRAKGLESDLYHVEALLTVTRDTLARPREVVDEYVSLGRKAIFLRPLNPFGFAVKTFKEIGYQAEEFIEFYKEAVDYMLELNRKGVEILERTAAILLTKMLTPHDPNYLDLRSPCGAGIGQIAYNFDGKVFTCDEGRMVYQMGDDAFQIGELPTSTYADLIESPPVKALAVASTLEANPHCFECVFKPYCGLCPVYSYSEQGGIFGQLPTNTRCKIFHAILEFLFGKIASGDDEVLDFFRKWTIVRNRSVFFMHD